MNPYNLTMIFAPSDERGLIKPANALDYPSPVYLRSGSLYWASRLLGSLCAYAGRFYIEGIFLINSQHEVSLGFEQQQSWVDLQRYNFAKLAWNLYDLSPTFRALFDDGSINLGISYQKMLTDQDSSTQGSADNGILGLHCNFKF